MCVACVGGGLRRGRADKDDPPAPRAACPVCVCVCVCVYIIIFDEFRRFQRSTTVQKVLPKDPNFNTDTPEREAGATNTSSMTRSNRFALFGIEVHSFAEPNCIDCDLGAAVYAGVPYTDTLISGIQT